jgi:hypothetical protein
MNLALHFCTLVVTIVRHCARLKCVGTRHAEAHLDFTAVAARCRLNERKSDFFGAVPAEVLVEGCVPRRPLESPSCRYRAYALLGFDRHYTLIG